MFLLMTMLLFLALVCLLWAVILYNGLVRRRNMIKEAWSGIDVQLKRLANLIPNLVETVRGYAGHERETLERVTSLRDQGFKARSVAEQASVQSQLGRALGGLLAVAENYPELKADGTFLELQRNLAETENQIEQARRYFNGAVRDYNIQVESVPASLVARRFHFSPAQFFELEDPADRAVPRVEFGG